MKTLLCVALLLIPSLAGAVPTRVTVRVLAHDAKLIGDVGGGCAIMIRDAHTGEILDRGIQAGKTGDTDRIIRDPWVRGEQRLDTDGAAAWRTTLDLDAPRRVVVEARGPLGFAGSEFTTSRTVLLLPGHHLDGNGIVLTLQGLIVNLQEPDPEDALQGGSTIGIEAGVKLLCTCPIEPDSLWPAADYSVVVELREGGELIATAPLRISDRTNTFTGEIAIPEVEPGKTRVFELRICAANDGAGNFGTDAAVFRVRG